uniref:Uncharacterized protein n=1 Tax=Cacopsylla melanoneura TaxID=428564 RepID=A0A8D8UAY3_9HEMI
MPSTRSNILLRRGTMRNSMQRRDTILQQPLTTVDGQHSSISSIMLHRAGLRTRTAPTTIHRTGTPRTGRGTDTQQQDSRAPRVNNNTRVPNRERANRFSLRVVSSDPHCLYEILASRTPLYHEY